MFPNKVLQKVSKAEILQNARVGTSVPCLPSLKSQSVHTPAVLAIPFLHNSKCHFLKWKSAATAALSAQKAKRTDAVNGGEAVHLDH